MVHGHTINSSDQTSNNNSGKNNEHDNNGNNKGDDERGNHRHTPYVMNVPVIVSEKWTSSQVRKTSDAQSTVYNTWRKKRVGLCKKNRGTGKACFFWRR